MPSLLPLHCTLHTRSSSDRTPAHACRVAFAQKDVWEGYSGSGKDTVEVEVGDVLAAEAGSCEHCVTYCRRRGSSSVTPQFDAADIQRLTC